MPKNIICVQRVILNYLGHDSFKNGTNIFMQEDGVILNFCVEDIFSFSFGYKRTALIFEYKRMRL